MLLKSDQGYVSHDGKRLLVVPNIQDATPWLLRNNEMSTLDGRLWWDVWDPEEPRLVLYQRTKSPNQQWRWTDTEQGVHIQSLVSGYVSCAGPRLVVGGDEPCAFQLVSLNAKIPKKTAAFFRVVTYNVQEWRNNDFALIPWNDKMRDYVPAEHDASDDTVAVLYELDGDVVGLQETSAASHREHDMLGHLYDATFCKADQGWFSRLQNGLLVKHNLLIRSSREVTISHGLSKQVTDVPRCMQVAVVTLPNGMDVCFASVHLSYKANQKMENARQALAYLENVRDVCLMGDFNSNQGDAVYNFITATYYDAALLRGGPVPSRPDGLRIDYVFLKHGWDFQRLPLLATHVHRNYHSDHFPLVVDFGLT